ncbi:hypothetical protein [Neobacillus vireti]
MGNSKIKDIDVLDKRLDLIGEEIDQERTLYIQGKKGPNGVTNWFCYLS